MEDELVGGEEGEVLALVVKDCPGYSTGGASLGTAELEELVDGVTAGRV